MKKIYFYFTPIILFGGIFICVILALFKSPDFNPFDFFISHLGSRYVTNYPRIFDTIIIIGGISIIPFAIMTYKKYNIIHLILFFAVGVLLIFAGIFSFDISVIIHGYFSIPMFICLILGQSNFWILTLKNYNRSIFVIICASYSTITGIIFLVNPHEFVEWLYFYSIIPMFYFVKND